MIFGGQLGCARFPSLHYTWRGNLSTCPHLHTRFNLENLLWLLSGTNSLRAKPEVQGKCLGRVEHEPSSSVLSGLVKTHYYLLPFASLESEKGREDQGQLPFLTLISWGAVITLTFHMPSCFLFLFWDFLLVHMSKMITFSSPLLSTQRTFLWFNKDGKCWVQTKIHYLDFSELWMHLGALGIPHWHW